MTEYYAVRIIKPDKEVLVHFDGPFQKWELGAAVDLGDLEAEDIDALIEIVEEEHKIELSKTWVDPDSRNAIILFPHQVIEGLRKTDKARFQGLLRRYSEGIVRRILDDTFINPLVLCEQCVCDIRQPEGQKETIEEKRIVEERLILFLRKNPDFKGSANSLADLAGCSHTTIDTSPAWKAFLKGKKSANREYAEKYKGTIEDDWEGIDEKLDSDGKNTNKQNGSLKKKK